MFSRFVATLIYFMISNVVHYGIVHHDSEEDTFHFHKWTCYLVLSPETLLQSHGRAPQTVTNFSINFKITCIIVYFQFN